MEHKLILGGGEQYLPFARSRIKALRAAGLEYASQQYEIDGASVKVRIVGEQEYIRISGGIRDLLMVVNLVDINVNTPLDSPPGVVKFTANIQYSRVYRLDLKDPMDAKKAKLVYSGASSLVVESSEAVYGTEPTNFTNSYFGTAAGYVRPFVTGAALIDGYLALYSVEEDITNSTNFLDFPSNFEFHSESQQVRRTTVTYGPERTVIHESTHTEVDAISSSSTTARTYSGGRLYTWPYFVNTTTIDGVPRRNIHAVIGPSNYSVTFTTPPGESDPVGSANALLPLRVPYRWTPVPGTPSDFVLDGAPLPLNTLVPQAMEYTYEEIGSRQRGFNFIRYSLGALDRFGNPIPAVLPGNNIAGDLLSQKYYVGLTADNLRFKTKRISDDAGYGSEMVIAELPGMLSDPAYAAAVVGSIPFAYGIPITDLTQPNSYIRNVDGSDRLRISFATEVTDLTNAAEEWLPKVP